MQDSNTSAVQKAIENNLGRPGALLPILHDIQDSIGFIPSDAVPAIASSLNLSRAEVHGVITFYHHFREEAPGQHIIEVCQAEACQSMNSKALTKHVESSLGVSLGETTSDQKITLLPVYCLGNCACAPSVTIDGEVFGRVTSEKFDKLLNTYAKEVA